MVEDMREVSQDEFFRAIGRLNVHPRIVTDRYPYTSEWRMQDTSQRMIGKTVGKTDGSNSYFLNWPEG